MKNQGYYWSQLKCRWSIQRTSFAVFFFFLHCVRTIYSILYDTPFKCLRWTSCRDSQDHPDETKWGSICPEFHFLVGWPSRGEYLEWSPPPLPSTGDVRLTSNCNWVELLSPISTVSSAGSILTVSSCGVSCWLRFLVGIWHTTCVVRHALWERTPSLIIICWWRWISYCCLDILF